jgi:hypothetical protein
MARYTGHYLLRIDEAFWPPIDEWRRKQPNLPSRAEAIRRLIDKGLEADRGDGEGNGG